MKKQCKIIAWHVKFEKMAMGYTSDYDRKELEII